MLFVLGKTTDKTFAKISDLSMEINSAHFF